MGLQFQGSVDLNLCWYGLKSQTLTDFRVESADGGSAVHECVDLVAVDFHYDDDGFFRWASLRHLV